MGYSKNQPRICGRKEQDRFETPRIIEKIPDFDQLATRPRFHLTGLYPGGILN